jgi:hypothetical protein
MERISDLYQNPNDIENKQCTNPIYNSSENTLSVIEQSINSSLLENNSKISHSKIFKIVFLIITFCILLIVGIVVYYVINGDKI